MEIKEAIEVIKKNYPHVNESCSQFETALRTLIPELKENKDEKIRQFLIHEIEETSDEIMSYRNMNKKDVIAWLEKQCEQDSLNIKRECLKGIKRVQEYQDLSDWEKDFDNIASMYAHNKNQEGYNDSWYVKERAAEMLYHAKKELEKQGEQHPKFRIGDTIKKKITGNIVTISEIDLKTREYRLSNSGFIPFKYEHLWELVEQNPADIIPKDFESYVEQLLSLSDGEGHGSPAKVKEVSLELLKLAKIGQKPTWSEEDDKQARQIERIVHIDGCTQKLQKQIADWLKSIKKRIGE